MSGYRCVNYYELCRLCTASHCSKKVHIFSEEGRKKNLYEKIAGCLPIVVSPLIQWCVRLNFVYDFTAKMCLFQFAFRSVKRTNCRKSSVRSVSHKLKQLSNSAKHAWMPSQCSRVAWIHRSYEMVGRFVFILCYDCLSFLFFLCCFWFVFVLILFWVCVWCFVFVCAKNVAMFAKKRKY